MPKAKETSRFKDIFMIILSLISTLALLFIAISILQFKKEFNNISTELSNIESDMGFLKTNISVLKEETGWEGWDNSKNSKKSTLQSCITGIKTFSASSGSDYTTYMLICIANYLAD